MTTISPVFVGSTVINCKFRTCIIHCKAVAIVTSYLRNTPVITSITRHVCFFFGVKVIIWLFTPFRSCQLFSIYVSTTGKQRISSFSGFKASFPLSSALTLSKTTAFCLLGDWVEEFRYQC